MAIESLKEKLTLRLELDAGLVDGKQKVKAKSFTQIDPAAGDQALYNTASLISELQERDLVFVKKVETTALFNK